MKIPLENFNEVNLASGHSNSYFSCCCLLTSEIGPDLQNAQRIAGTNANFHR
jgi:hypothetical protein